MVGLSLGFDVKTYFGSFGFVVARYYDATQFVPVDKEVFVFVVVAEVGDLAGKEARLADGQALVFQPLIFCDTVVPYYEGVDVDADIEKKDGFFGKRGGEQTVGDNGEENY